MIFIVQIFICFLFILLSFVIKHMYAAACDLVYLGSVDVPGPGSDVLLANTVQQRKSLDISVSIVTFKAAKEGITISDNVSG